MFYIDPLKMFQHIHNLPVALKIASQKVQTTSLASPELEKAGIRLLVQRDDLVHPIAGGNKWRKLKYNLLDFASSGRSVMVTYGGAWSNHVAAVAFAGQQLGIKTAAVIRGEPAKIKSLTLLRAEEQGMDLFFVSRTLYRDKDKALEAVFHRYHPEDVFVIPEGGCNDSGFTGCLEIVSEIDHPFDIICCPCGTGTTLAGLAASSNKQVLGFSVLKNSHGIDDTVRRFSGTAEAASWKSAGRLVVNHGFHFGGFARSSPALDVFVQQFSVDFGIPIEPVYTGKMFYGIFELARSGYFKRGSVVLAIHTGGLQYLDGMN